MPINATLRRVRLTIGAVEKQYVLHIVSVCLWPYLSSLQRACAILYRPLWPVWLCQIFPLFLINGMIFSRGGGWGGGAVEHNMCVRIFSTTFVSNISHFKNNSARYHK